MKRWNMRSALLVAGLAVSGCSLDYTDPNLPTEPTVFSDPQYVMAIGVGLQAEMANQIGPFIFSSSLIASETGAGLNTFPNFQAADRGDQLDPAQYLSEEPWGGHYRVVKLTDDLLRAVPELNMLPGTASGLLAMAKLFRAMAFGDLIQLFEQIPIQVGIENRNPAFVPRAQVLTEVLRLLNEARQDLLTTPVSTEFTTVVLAPGFDLMNTIDAMIARYSLIAGDLPGALAAAQRVNLTVYSEFRHSANDRNSVNAVMYNSGNAFQLRPRQELRQQADAGDQRVVYWVQAAAVAGVGGRVLDELNQFRVPEAPFRVYFPDEMRLIMAEVHARQNNLAQARTLINAVRTQCPPTGTTPVEPMACLPALSDAQLATQAAILTEILKQRRFELFLQGLRQEDLRRFNQTLKYPWLPFPQSECDRNTNAPC